jgi:hypothetical protein
MSKEVASSLLKLVREGATLLITAAPEHAPGLGHSAAANDSVKLLGEELFGGIFNKVEDLYMKQLGKGRVIKGPYEAASFDVLGITRDFIVKDSVGTLASGIAWTHRSAPDREIYFISNQLNVPRVIEVSLRGKGRVPELYDAVTDESIQAKQWKFEKDHTIVPLRLEANGSVFVILGEPSKKNESDQDNGNNWPNLSVKQTLSGKWDVYFDSANGGPVETVTFGTLSDWSKHEQPGIRYYSGTAKYSQSFLWSGKNRQRVWLDLGRVANIASVTLNGVGCGVAWTAPYRVEITDALRSGENKLEIEVTNTWANRLIGDHTLPEEQRITKTIAPYRLEGKPLLEAGLLGPVTIVVDEIRSNRKKKK